MSSNALKKLIDYNSPARGHRTESFHGFLSRHPCPFRGRAATPTEEREWDARIGAWFSENSAEVDAEELARQQYNSLLEK